MYHLTKKLTFCASHFLPCYAGNCNNLHGHNWKVTIKISTDILINSMILDFSVIKDSIMLKYDHKNLNEVITNPTAENIAYDIYELIKGLLPNFNNTKKNISITVEETENNEVTYEENY